MFHYDDEADAAYILIEPETAIYKTIGTDQVIFDFDAELRVVGIEILSPPAVLLKLFETNQPLMA